MTTSFAAVAAGFFDKGPEMDVIAVDVRSQAMMSLAAGRLRCRCELAA